MAATAGSFDIGRPFVYVFEDKNWITKVLIGGAVLFGSIIFSILLVGIVGLMLITGYQRRVALAVAAGTDVPLPELFEQPGEDIMNGLKMMCIGFVWLLPAIALRIVGAIAMIAMSAATSGGGGGGEDAVAGIAVMIMLGTTCLAFILQIAGSIMAFGGILRFWDSGEMGAGFKVGEIIALMKRQWVNMLLAFVVMMGAGFAAEMVGFMLLCIGIFFTMFWSNLASAHAFGQIIKLDRVARGAS